MAIIVMAEAGFMSVIRVLLSVDEDERNPTMRIKGIHNTFDDTVQFVVYEGWDTVREA